MTEDLFRKLLDKGECSTLDYKEQHYFSSTDSKDKDSHFVKDVISLANTIRDETSFIIIGVKEDNFTKKGLPIGINSSERVDNSQLQSKVKSKVTPMVQFSCYPFSYEDKEFDIIEIPVVFYNQPIVPNFTKGDFLVSNKVYTRGDSSNMEADQSQIQRINEWLKKIPKSKTHTRSSNINNHNSIFFDEETIQNLFGNEAAEDENMERLKEYYFKNNTYQRVVAKSPIRILVGHKGIGKSALFKIARDEDAELGKIALFLKPDEISTFGHSKSDFLEIIKSWKEGLIKIIFKKTLFELGFREIPNYELDLLLNQGLMPYISELVETENIKGSLNAKKNNYVSKFLSEPLINVYIDDLDRGWIGGKIDITRISALLNAVRDLTQDNKGLQFRISLRSDVYYLVRTSDESTDKIGNSVIWYQWTHHEILVLLAKRIRTYFSKDTDERYLLSATQSEVAENLYEIIESNFQGRGKWENQRMYNILLSVIRKRPRDLVKLLTLAARNANQRNSNKILTKDLEAIFDEYSQDRIQDTINEYRSELPEIQRLIFGMKPNRKTKTAAESFYYTTPALKEKLYNIMQNTTFYFANGNKANVSELAQFLYKINFITATKKLPDGFIDRKYFEENRYISSDFVDFGYDWEVHMAFRWGLQPDIQDNIFSDL